MKRCKSCGDHLPEDKDEWCGLCSPVPALTMEEIDEAFADIAPLSNPYGGLIVDEFVSSILVNEDELEIIEEVQAPPTLRPHPMPPPKPTTKIDLLLLKKLLEDTK